MDEPHKASLAIASLTTFATRSERWPPDTGIRVRELGNRNPVTVFPELGPGDWMKSLLDQQANDGGGGHEQQPLSVKAKHAQDP